MVFGSLCASLLFKRRKGVFERSFFIHVVRDKLEVKIITLCFIKIQSAIFIKPIYLLIEKKGAARSLSIKLYLHHTFTIFLYLYGVSLHQISTFLLINASIFLENLSCWYGFRYLLAETYYFDILFFKECRYRLNIFLNFLIFDKDAIILWIVFFFYLLNSYQGWELFFLRFDNSLFYFLLLFCSFLCLLTHFCSLILYGFFFVGHIKL